MAHYSRLDKIVIDVTDSDHTRELDFWQGALGQTLTHIERFPEFHGLHLSKQDFGLLMQRLGAGPSRVHLDFHTTDVEAEVARLEKLGATRVDQHHFWVILRDPAGLPFCVVLDSRLNESNATHWDEAP